METIRQPNRSQIRLPFSVPKPKKSSDPPAKVCGICRIHDSRYTCPRCNIPYCSLACFRNPDHVQCSEPFYHQTVKESIASDPRAGNEERRKMMEMLRRFEEGAEGLELDGLDEEEEEENGDEEEDEDLAKILDGVDLESIDSNALFHLLPQYHRDKFIAALQNPESMETKELLRSVDIGMPSVLPWWEREVLDSNEEDGELAQAEGGNGEIGTGREKQYSVAPEPLGEDVLVGIKPPERVGLKLRYNMLAICIAYLHTLLSFRLPSLDPKYLAAQGVSHEEIKKEIGDLLPFLIDPRSTIRYDSASSAWASVWELIGTQINNDSGNAIAINTSPSNTSSQSQAPTPISTSVLHRLLITSAPFFHPPITTDPPRFFHVLADLYRLFAMPKIGNVAKKIAFYYVIMAKGGIGRGDWLKLEKEVRKEAEKIGEIENGDKDEVVERTNLLVL